MPQTCQPGSALAPDRLPQGQGRLDRRGAAEEQRIARHGAAVVVEDDRQPRLLGPPTARLSARCRVPYDRPARRRWGRSPRGGGPGRRRRHRPSSPRGPGSPGPGPGRGPGDRRRRSPAEAPRARSARATAWRWMDAADSGGFFRARPSMAWRSVSERCRLPRSLRPLRASPASPSRRYWPAQRRAVRRARPRSRATRARGTPSSRAGRRSSNRSKARARSASERPLSGGCAIAGRLLWQPRGRRAELVADRMSRSSADGAR